MARMRKFTFRLDPILDLKESLERAAQVELGKLQAAHREAVAELDRLRQHRDDQRVQLSNQQCQLQLNMERIESHVEYLTLVERHIREQQEVIVDLAQKVAAQRDQLIARTKEKNVLLKLKERQKSIHAEEVLRDEEQSADEVVTTRSSRGMVMGGE
ncbi:MAG: flagellar export protein FliJ [Chloroflexota bacterium]|nr:MAG: flagellar export protein FliJ [Chloroflexota bacterium]